MKTADREAMLLAARDFDLEASGLSSPSVIKKLKIGKPIGWQQVEEMTGLSSRRVKAGAYEIPYFGVGGKPLHYSRWKLIVIEGETDIKYYQEPKTIPHLYLPPLVDWKKITEDPRKRLIITEGEKKAACATLHGLPTIGVGGVWSWKSKKWGMDELSDLDWFTWQNREVEICYDGDMYTNEDVHRAREALASALITRGAQVYIRFLPNTGGKTALDDFLVAYGVERYEKLQCEEASASKELSLLNDRVAYVENINAFVSLDDGVILRDERSLSRKHGTIKVADDKGRKIPAVDLWSRWPHRRSIKKLTYSPGSPRMINGAYNTWTGWGTTPRRGTVNEFLDLVKSVDGWRWFLQWLAYPVQNPGAKLNSAVVIWSVHMGTGKSFIGEVMRDIYGRGNNSSVITSADLHGNYNGWLANKQFVMGEEVSDFAGRADYNLLKSYITGESVLLKEKFVPGYELPNCANFYFTSNHPNPVKIDRNDRRFFVATLEDERPAEFWRDLDRWRHHGGGPAAWMWYLQNEVDVSDFNPKSRPPVTEAKTNMVLDSMSSVEQWCYMLSKDPDAVIQMSLGDQAKILDGQDVFTLSQVVAWMPEDLQRKTDLATFGRIITNLGMVRKPDPVRVIMRDGSRQVHRLVAVRNTWFWGAKIEDNKLWAANYCGDMTVANKERKNAKPRGTPSTRRKPRRRKRSSK